MRHVFSKMKYLIIATIIVLILFFYFGVFSPLEAELEKSLNQNFQSTVSILEINVENELNRYKEGAESLSSRTMIRNELAEYKNGEVSFHELQNYTQEKYSDGVKVLKNIIAAFRVSENKIIASWGEKEINSYEEFINYNNTTTEIKILKKDFLVLINSTINKDNNKLGNDIVIFNLKPLMNEINSENINCEIIYSEEKINGVEKDNIVVEYRRLLNTNYWLKSETLKNQLYHSLNSLSSKIIGGFSILLFIISVVFYRTLTSTSKEVINELENKVEIITEISETDDMLGIYNRSKFIDVLKSEISRSRRYNHDLSLIMFDLDCFKVINDEYGHQVGDEILIEITEIIESEIREIDLFARYGGDEFMILNPETKLENAVRLAERLKKKISSTNFTEVNKITLSFGVTELKDKDDIDSLLKRVDDALYKAKESRNAVYYF